MNETTATEVAFFGRITAGFTHEMKNILAIIKESSGLLEDLLGLAGETPFPHRDRFVQRVSVIQQQVGRGVELATRLNRFAHSADEPVARVDFSDLVEQLVRLSERFARLKEVSLKAVRCESPVVLRTSPVHLQMIIFAVMESCWNHVPAGGTVELRVGWHGKEPCVTFDYDAEIADAAELRRKIEAAETVQAVRQMLASLGGRILAEQESGPLALVFAAGEQ